MSSVPCPTAQFSIALRQSSDGFLSRALRRERVGKKGWVFGTCPDLRGNDACLYLWGMKFKKKQDPWDFRLTRPWEDLVATLACRRPFVYSLLE